MQFRPGAPQPPPPPPPPQMPFIPVAPPQFQPIGHATMRMPPPGPPQQHQYSRVAPPPLAHPPPPNRPGLIGHSFTPLPPQQFQPPFGGHIPPPSYTPSSAIGQQQINVGPTFERHSAPQFSVSNFPAGGQPWFPAGSQPSQLIMPPQQGQPWFPIANHNINSANPLQQTNGGAQQWVPSQNHDVGSDAPSKTEEKSVVMINEKPTQNDPVEVATSGWKKHISKAGDTYYNNRALGISSWHKPAELMTLTEKADATTDWTEYTSPEGLKYYHNKVTKIRTWILPDEVKLAREQANMSSGGGTHPNASTAVSNAGTQASTLHSNSLSLPGQPIASSPIPAAHAISLEPAVTSGSSIIQEEFATVTPVSGTTPITSVDALVQDGAPPPLSSSAEEIDESAGVSESKGTSISQGQGVEREPLVYATKEEAKNAFKALLQSADVGPGWTWDQAMRAIKNDQRYAALNTTGERKQVFNEFVTKKKKQEAEERRARNRKAREDFKAMLEESKELTSSTRWSRVVSIFENDERFYNLERSQDREDIYADHIDDLKEKEQVKAVEEKRRHIAEYSEFLRSCAFITENSEWRKVQHQLEGDERCSRLDKLERLELFQEYVRDLEKEEEEQRKLRKEEQRKVERKNRDEFRKLMEEHVANGTLTVETVWRNYFMKIKDDPAYLAVLSNTAGSTAKNLFDDVLEDLDKQYVEDKERIEDAITMEKISLSTSWTIEDLKAALSKEITSKPISDINFKVAFDELLEKAKEREEKEAKKLLEKAKEREEKEAKKRIRLSADVHDFLISSKEISTSSKWEDAKSLIEERFNAEDSFLHEVFNEVLVYLKDKEKDKEDRRRKDDKAKKEKDRKERKEKDRSRDKEFESSKHKERRKREGTDSGGVPESHGMEEKRRSRSRDRDRKHRKRRVDSPDRGGSLDDKNEGSMSHRRSVDSKRPKKERWSDGQIKR